MTERELLVDAYVVISRLLDNEPPAEKATKEFMARHLMGLISAHLYPKVKDAS